MSEPQSEHDKSHSTDWRHYQHPDKTQIGKIENGFDWLGAWFDGRGNVTVAPRALSNFATKLHRLYEQTRRLSAPEQQRRVEKYIKQWQVWARYTVSAITGSPVELNTNPRPCVGAIRA